MSTLRACSSVAGHASGSLSAGGSFNAARSTGQRMPGASRSFAASRSALPSVAIDAVGASSVTRASGACSRAAADAPMATSPGTLG